MGKLNKTALNDQHVQLGANMVEFGGWEMPLHYETGIVQEHLATRKAAGLFDISHMGRFIVRGKNRIDFLQHVLTNNAAALEEEEGHYTMIPNESGGVIDDAYLYRFVPDEFILVVNAANREKDFAHLDKIRSNFGDVELIDQTAEMAMLSLQGPTAKDIMQ
ncbi:MAG: glycine cleavage system protein T, partial [Desulfobacterales bacterium]